MATMEIDEVPTRDRIGAWSAASHKVLVKVSSRERFFGRTPQPAARGLRAGDPGQAMLIRIKATATVKT
jgi:hypothetical protein